jgi:CheY-like chemotaxis protein
LDIKYWEVIKDKNKPKPELTSSGQQTRHSHSIPDTTKKDGTILYIEDDQIIRELIQGVLTKEGYKVDVAEDGEIALKKLEKSYYDLVLSNITMPKLSGIDVLRKIKTAGLKQGKIVMFSNRSDVINEAFELGVDGYEPKYLNTPDELAKRINGYLAGSISKENSKKRALGVDRETKN